MSQTIRYDLLGAVKYPQVALRGCQRGSAIAVLDNYFMKGAKKHDDLYKRILNHKKNFTLLVHGIWNNDHNFGPADIAKAIRTAKRLQKICDATGKKIYFSPFLEHRKGVVVMQDVFNKIALVAPDLLPMSTGITHSPMFTTEIHNNDWGTLPMHSYFFSTDGTDARTENIPALKSEHHRATQFGMWIPECNGKKTLHDSTPPTKRKNWPKIKDLRQLTKLYGSPVGVPIPQPGGIPASQLQFKNGNLWKKAIDGNLVVLLRGDWPRAEWAKVKKKDGKWGKMRDTGYDNPHNGKDRLHLRGELPPASYASNNKGGGVKFKADGHVYFIPLPGKAGDRHD